MMPVRGRRRYHRDIYLPPGVPLHPTSADRLVWTDHAWRALRDDGFSKSRLEHIVLAEDAKCIDITMEGDTVLRWLMRQPLTPSKDICLVMEAGGVVVTCWVNYKTDGHRFLDRRLYATY